MRIASLSGRLSLVVDGLAVDITEASSGASRRPVLMPGLPGSRRLFPVVSGPRAESVLTLAAPGMSAGPQVHRRSTPGTSEVAGGSSVAGRLLPGPVMSRT
jgi:hypothetical protein